MTDYNAIKAVNFSTLKHMERSPKHYRHGLENPPPDSDVFRFGRALHCHVLEPLEFPARFIAWEGGRRYGKAWDAFQAENAGLDILTVKDMDQILRIGESIWTDPVCSGWLDGMRHVEHVLTWTDAETGIECKGRCDLVSGAGILTDLKTARDSEPGAMARSAARYGYAAQIAFYLDGAQAMGLPVCGAAILAVEKSAPYDCGVLVLDDIALDAGRSHYRALLRQLARCLDTDSWPGCYAGTHQTLALPSWAPGMDEDFTIEEF